MFPWGSFLFNFKDNGSYILAQVKSTVFYYYDNKNILDKANPFYYLISIAGNKSAEAREQSNLAREKPITFNIRRFKMDRKITGGMDKSFLARISAQIFNQAKTILVDRASKKEASDKESEAPTHRGYYRSEFYTCPSFFYNHKSRTFSRNRRAQMKLAASRR